MGVRRPMPAASDLSSSIAITGASGALGRHVLRELLRTHAGRLHALTHRTALPADLTAAGVSVHQGSLLDRAALDRWLPPGATVVHLAYPAELSPDDHRRAVENLAAACAATGARRVVHCSTAVVAGRTRARRVTEETPCVPVSDYERIKHDLEHVFANAARKRFPLVIARPTAVFGPGLRNLVTMIEAIERGSPLVNYARASLYGHRQLHLVPVETVASALRFLALDLPDGALAGTDHTNSPLRFIVSTDHRTGGDFRSVDRRLRQALGRRDPPPRLPVPPAALAVLLRASGRTDADPHRIYDGSALERAGFVPPVNLTDALDAYAGWWRTNARHGAGDNAA